MGHVDALSSGFMWITTTGDSRSSDEVSYALLSSRKLPPDEETLPNMYTLGWKARRVRGLQGPK